MPSSQTSLSTGDKSPKLGHIEGTAGESEDPLRINTTYRPDVDTSSINEKKLLRKLDWALVPWLSFLYLLSFLDRTSIGNARVSVPTLCVINQPSFSRQCLSLQLYNLEPDLHITDTQYNLALTIFFFSYSVFEVPSNIFLKRLRPSIWLSLLMFLWGIMMTVQGLVHNYGGLFGMRWMLGVFEAGLFPGVNYYLSW